jgi:hypothetical protein
VFKVTSSGALTTLYSFCAKTNCTDGSVPVGLVLGTDGNFYGTTSEGGISADPAAVTVERSSKSPQRAN